MIIHEYVSFLINFCSIWSLYCIYKQYIFKWENWNHYCSCWLLPAILWYISEKYYHIDQTSTTREIYKIYPNILNKVQPKLTENFSCNFKGRFIQSGTPTNKIVYVPFVVSKRRYFKFFKVIKNMLYIVCASRGDVVL